jgi:hypothetical protein
MMKANIWTATSSSQKGRLIRLVTAWVETLFGNTLFKARSEGQKRRKDKEEDVSSYWMTLRNERILETERGSTRSHSVKKLALEEAMGLSQDGLQNEWSYSPEGCYQEFRKMEAVGYSDILITPMAMQNIIIRKNTTKTKIRPTFAKKLTEE